MNTTFQILNGPTYTDDNRPPFWRNEKPLTVPYQEDCLWLDMKHAPLADFPLVEDFEVWLEFYRNEFGYHAGFYSASRGYIATFAWWDHIEQDMISDDFIIPLGKYDRPFHLFEESWEIHIALIDDFVYVLEGQWDDDIAANCHSWFKVQKERYVAEWGRAIEACRETFLTDDQ